MATVTYNGESESIEWFGVSFKKGKAVKVDDAPLSDTDRESLLRLADKNALFEVEGYEPPAENEAPKRRGRPPKAAE